MVALASLFSLAALVPAALLLGPCSTLPSLKGRTRSTAFLDTGATRLGRAIAPRAAAHPGLSGVYPLRDARDAFAARFLMARAVERSLDVQYYIWHRDLSGTLLLGALLDAAGRGVRVRFLMDDNSTAGLDGTLAAAPPPACCSPTSTSSPPARSCARCRATSTVTGRAPRRIPPAGCCRPPAPARSRRSRGARLPGRGAPLALRPPAGRGDTAARMDGRAHDQRRPGQGPRPCRPPDDAARPVQGDLRHAGNAGRPRVALPRAHRRRRRDLHVLGAAGSEGQAPHQLAGGHGHRGRPLRLREVAEALLAAGGTLYELRLAPGAPAERGPGLWGSSGSSLHAKTFAVDRAKVFIGSFNFDPRSARLNTEMGFVIDSPGLAGQIAETFDEEVPPAAYEVRLSEAGELVWIERRDGALLRHESEPGASAWRRAQVWLLSKLPIEGLL